MSKQDTSKESLEALMQIRQASQEYDKLKKQLVREELQAILNELPEEKEDAVKQGELIPFDKKRKVEMDWLRKCQDAGYNQALQEVKSIIEKRLK